MFAAYEAAVVPLQLNPQSRQPDLNRKPAVYETAALPLRYGGRKWTTGNDPAPSAWKADMLPVTPCPHMPKNGISNFPFGRLVNGVDSPAFQEKILPLDSRDRTWDPLLVRQMLSQLS